MKEEGRGIGLAEGRSRFEAFSLLRFTYQVFNDSKAFVMIFPS